MNNDQFQNFEIKTLFKKIDEFRTETNDNFKSVHARQDKTNGRITQTEKDLIVLYERWAWVIKGFAIISFLLGALGFFIGKVL